LFSKIHSMDELCTNIYNIVYEGYGIHGNHSSVPDLEEAIP
jgi:hypothetical protein